MTAEDDIREYGFNGVVLTLHRIEEKLDLLLAKEQPQDRQDKGMIL